MKENTSNRFHAKITFDSPGGCWIWDGALNGNGYGVFSLSGRNELAHRVAWKIHRGELQAGIKVLHRCDVPACCNPEHLFLGSDADNMADRDAKGRHVPSPGEANGHAKLTDSKVKEILSLRGIKSQTEIARIFGVHQTCISRIHCGQAWNHLDGTGV